MFGLATDSSGNVYLLLYAGSNVDIDGDGVVETIGTYLLSLEPGGRHRWVRRVGDGSPFDSIAMALSPDASTVVTALGATLSWIATSDGSTALTTDLGPPSGWDSVDVVDLAWHADELFVGSIVLRTGSAGILLTKLDAGGVESSHRVYETGGGRYPSPLSAIDVNARGDLVLVAETTMSLDLGTGTAVAGEFIARLDGDLLVNWAVELPIANDGEVAPDVAVSDAGDVVGGYDGPVGAFGETWPDPCAGAPASCRSLSVVSFDSDGMHRWSRQFQGTTLLGSTDPSVTFDERGGLAVTGTFAGNLDVCPYGNWTAGSSEGGCDAFLAIFDAEDESVLEARRLTGPSCPENVSATVVDPFGATILAGTFRISATLLRGTYSSAGEVDAFLIRVSD